MSWLRACARVSGRVSESVRARNMRKGGGRGGVGVLSESGNSLLAESDGVRTGMWVRHLLSASLVSVRLL